MKKLLPLLILTLAYTGSFAQSKADTSESEMILRTSTGNIAGTLTVPQQEKPMPVVIIIPGSGPTDRNGNSPIGLHTDVYKMLAEGLAKNKIASLRYDKRGIGESKAAMPDENSIRFDTYVQDVVDWITELKADKRFSKIYLLGHSEGSLIGMLAAEKNKVAGYISVSGPGRPMDEILREQLSNKLPPQLLSESDNILDSLKAGKTVANVPPALNTLYRPSVQPYMISHMKYNPAKEIAKLKMPVLIIQGTTDLQVPVSDARLLKAAKPDAQLDIIDNMNHVLKESDNDQQHNLATYRSPDFPLKAGLMNDLVQFIKH
ncbi:alpha/beta hydrolase [Prolixibacter sp. NT017]|uniref:alpha/beta hydrolase n=1 Tax=Prolixibacter sp. NT017 TaxID=2652390 RepID=UPI00127E4571|nr:alpha/beta fold hydrolase [Prolixibacter sp. NT017]GET24792.1 alpha/beta hydrolase [Prolixibacter sp. NT017]